MILLHNLLEAPEDEAGDYSLKDEKKDTDAIEDTNEEDQENPQDEDTDNEESNADNIDEEESNTDDTIEMDDSEPSEDDNVSPEDDNAVDNTDDVDSGETGDVDEKNRNYLLAKTFQNLYNMTDTIITGIDKIKFENDYKINAKNYVQNQLAELKNVLYDYIIITMNTKTYEQNLIYIESYKNMIKTLIKSLKNIQDSDNSI